MKLLLKNPITFEGEIYEYAFLSLSTSTGYNNPDQYTFALRLTPYRVNESGEIIKLEDATMSYSYLNVLDSDNAGTEIAILNSIQELINK